MTERTGYIRLFRKLLESPIWTHLAPAVIKVAIFFLLRANYRTSKWYDGSKMLEIPAGSFVTSIAKTAEGCHLSVQQVRDAFDHLSRTRFATYRRTKRWTLVTVLNWGAYQASEDQPEHRGEHTAELIEEPTGDHVENDKGTTDKELRIKNNTLSAAETAAACDDAAETFDLSDQERAEGWNESANGNQVSGANGKLKKSPLSPEAETVLGQVAGRIHARHPAVRRCGMAEAKKLLRAIARRAPAAKRIDLLHQIDQNHAACCKTLDWQKDGGQFAKGLDNWLAPTKERWAEPPAKDSRQAQTDSHYFDENGHPRRFM